MEVTKKKEKETLDALKGYVVEHIKMWVVGDGLAKAYCESKGYKDNDPKGEFKVLMADVANEVWSDG